MEDASSTRSANAKACAGRLEDIHRLIDRQLSPRLLNAVREHLRSCAGCEAYHHTMEQVAVQTRTLLRTSVATVPPRFATLRTPIMRQLEQNLRADACGHLVDLARHHLSRSEGPPVRLTLPANPQITSVRRLRDLVLERKQLGDTRRHVKGPWTALSALIERQLNAESREPSSVGDLATLALGFQADDGSAHLLAAAAARVEQDEARLTLHLEAAAGDANPKTRALAHTNLASVAAYRGQFDDALKQLRVAQVYDEGSPWLTYVAALFSFATGATREVKRHLQSLAETLQRSRRADEFRGAMETFLPSDIGYLAEAHGLPPVAQAHFRRMAAQTLPPIESVSPARAWPCTVSLALFDLG